MVLPESAVVFFEIHARMLIRHGFVVFRRVCYSRTVFGNGFKNKGSNEAFRIERSDAEGDKMKRLKAMFSAVLAVATVASLAACGTANNSGDATTKDGKTIIKIQTFNNFGYGKPTNERPSADL